MQLDPNFEDIQTAVKSILEDILKKTPFELHFGRKPNTEWSNFRDKLKSSLNLDQQRLERSLLKPEEMRESADSRTRMKVVKKGMASRDVSPKLKRNEEELESIRALENLAKAASDWKLHRRHLTHKEGSEALRKLTERNPLLAASLRSDLNQGTLRFRVEQEVPEHRTKTSNLEFDLIHYPEKVVVYRKFLDRKSGRPLFKRFNGKIVKVTNNTYITENGKVIRKNHISLKPKLKSAYCSDLGKKIPAASTPRKPLHQCSSSGTNRPLHILPRPDVSTVSTSTENSDTENMTWDRPFERLDRLQAKTIKLYSSLTKIAQKNPPTLASRSIASPNVLKEVPSGGVIDLTMSSSRSPEHEVQLVPPVEKNLDAQSTEEYPISIILVATKEAQVENQLKESTNCPIPSVPTTEKEKTQGNTEETQNTAVTEKSNTSQNKEEKTDGKMGTTSETTEKKLEENKSADKRKPEKKREKRNGEGDNDSEVSNNSRSSGRSKRQTQFFGSPLRHSVKNIEEKQGLQTIPISPGDIPSSSGNTPSPSPRRKLRRPKFTTSKLEQAQGKKT